MILARLPEPFFNPDWLFEVKHDGFRALCYANQRSVKLVSRRGHVYKSFASLCDGIAADLRQRAPSSTGKSSAWIGAGGRPADLSFKEISGPPLAARLGGAGQPQRINGCRIRHAHRFGLPAIGQQ